MKNHHRSLGFRHKLFDKSVGEYGFSLVEVMVAAGMLAVVSLGVMKITEQTTRAGKHMNQQLDIVQLVNGMEQLLRNEAACSATLAETNGVDNTTGLNAGGLPLPSDPPGAEVGVPSIRDEAREERYSTAEKYGKITLTSFALISNTAANPLNAVTIDDPDNPGTIQVFKRDVGLRVLIRKGTSGDADIDRRTTNGGLNTRRVLAVTTFQTAGGEIKACYSGAVQYVDAACAALGTENTNSIAEAGRCRSLHIQNLTGADSTPTAATFHGDVRITDGLALTSPPTAAAEGNFFVDGSTTLGDAAADATLVNGTLAVTGITDLQNTIINSTGSNGGSVRVNDLLSVTGASDLQNTIINSTGSNGGSVRVNDNLLTTGTSTVTGVTDLQNTIINSTVSDGGSVRVNDNLLTTGTSTVTGTSDLQGRISNTTISDFGFVVVDDNFRVTENTVLQTTAVNLNLTVSGESQFNENVTLANGKRIFISTPAGYDLDSERQVVNKAWVRNAIMGTVATSLSRADKASITQAILAEASQYNSLKNALFDHLGGSSSTLRSNGNSNCNTAAGQAVVGITYNSTTNKFSVNCGAPTIAMCNSGGCVTNWNVYPRSDCSFQSPSATAHTGGTNYAATCPSGKMQKGYYGYTQWQNNRMRILCCSLKVN